MTGQMLALRIEMAWRGPTLCATGFNEMPHVDTDDDDVIFGLDDADNDEDNNDDVWANACIEN